MRLLPLIPVLLLAACASSNVVVDRDEAADFASYRTFAWWPIPGSEEATKRGPTTLLDGRVRGEVERLLTARGLARSDDPDLRIAHHLATREVRDVTVWDHGYRWRRRGLAHASVRTWVDGTLVLDVIDAKREALVWRGATRVPLGSTGPSEEDVREAVADLVAAYPAGP